MFGKIALKLSSGFLIETNEACYRTMINFIPVNAVHKDDVDQLEVGDTVSYFNGLIQKKQFINCLRCHKSYPESFNYPVCDCYDDLEIVRGEAVILSKVSKRYKHSLGWKITAHIENPLTCGRSPTKASTFNFVIFENSPFYREIGNSKTGDLCYLKGIVKSTNNEQNINDKSDNILLQVFHIKF